MSHGCSNVLIRCMDYRIDMGVHDFLLNNEMLGDTDVVSVAGSCKDLLKGFGWSESKYLLTQIEISIKLHGIKRIILTQHENCGPYGGLEVFGTVEMEKEFLIKEMKELKQKLAKRFPDQEILMFWFIRPEMNEDTVPWDYQPVED